MAYDAHQRVLLDDGSGNVLGAPASPMAMLDGYQSAVSQTWTSATPVNTAMTVPTAGYDTVALTVITTGIVTAGTIVFEIYDGVNWLPVKGFRPDSYLSDASISAVTGTSRAWQFSIAGFPQFRARLNPQVAGAGSVAVTAIVSSAPDVSGVTVGLDPNSPLPAGANLIGSVNAASSGVITNPTSVLTRPANTTAYAANTNVANTTVGTSIVVPSFNIANAAGAAIITKALLTTTAITGWGGVTVQIDLWRAAPTFLVGAGDGAAYAIATGSANYLGSLTGSFTQAGDGAYAELLPVNGNALLPKLTAGAAIYWTMSIQSAATPISGQTFTLTPEVQN